MIRKTSKRHRARIRRREAPLIKKRVGIMRLILDANKRRN